MVAMPPRKMLLVVSSRSAWECHMYASPAFGFWLTLAGGREPGSPRKRGAAVHRPEGEIALGRELHRERLAVVRTVFERYRVEMGR